MPSAEYMRDYRAGKKPGTKPNLEQLEEDDEIPSRGAGRPKTGKKLVVESFQSQGIENLRVLRALTHLIMELTPNPDALLLEHSGCRTVENAVIEGELVTEKELHALMYYSHFKQMGGNSRIFPSQETFRPILEQAKRERWLCKTDALFLGSCIGKNFRDPVYQAWTDFLPKFNPSGLRPDYDETDMARWLVQQKPKTRPDKIFRLLMASRRGRKSNFVLVWALSGTLCCPDLRFMHCSATRPLSEDFIGNVYRPYWTWGTYGCERFHQLFPEFCVDSGEGLQMEFVSPMAHLPLAQKSIQAISMESSSAGQRFDIGLFDDPISEKTVGNEDIRNKGVSTFDALMKLRTTGGFAIVIGTPWHVQDLYAELRERRDWAVRIDPVFTIKPEAQSKTLHQLTEADVNLNFPEALPWPEVQIELGSTLRQERFFRSQNLIEWLAEESSELKLNFEMSILTKALMPIAIIPREGETIISVDTAHTVSNRADLSALSVLRLFKNEQGAKSVIVLEQRGDRFHRAELAYELALLFKKWNPRVAIIEKPPYQEELELQIRLQSARYGIAMPIIWAEVDNTKNAKIQRIKSLEGLLPDRLRFAMGNWNDALFNQLENLSGVSRSTQKDDLADSIGLGVRYFRFPLFTDGPKEDAANQAAAEAAKKRADLEAVQSRIFGPTAPMGQLASTLEPYDQPAETSSPMQDAVHRTLGSVFHA